VETTTRRAAPGSWPISAIRGSTTAIGGNPGNIVLPPNFVAINTLANQAVGEVQALASAGARYILVPNISLLSNAALAASGNPINNPAANDARAQYDQTVWSGLAAKGINFIPADATGIQSFVLLNPAQFGITNVSINAPACGAVNSYQCGPANYVAPNADKTYFFADGPAAPDAADM
jgi:outer membrane lipase/esterase